MSGIAMPLMIFGGVLSAVSRIQAAQAQARFAEAQAAMERERIESQRRAAELQIEQKKREKVKFMGAQKARYGKAGVSMLGSPLDVLADTAAQFEWDIARIRENAESQIRLFGLRAGAFRSRAGSIRTAGFLGAGTSLLTMGAEIARRR
jgi:hypothetical protein